MHLLFKSPWALFGLHSGQWWRWIIFYQALTILDRCQLCSGSCKIYLIHRVRLVLRFGASLGQRFVGMWEDEYRISGSGVWVKWCCAVVSALSTETCFCSKLWRRVNLEPAFQVCVHELLGCHGNPARPASGVESFPISFILAQWTCVPVVHKQHNSIGCGSKIISCLVLILDLLM